MKKLTHKHNARWLLLTQLLLLVYSMVGVLSKLASREQFMSIRFLVYYGLVLIVLAGYALGWQQVIKHLPLTTAYANKATTIVWGVIWGALFFREKVTAGMLVGASLVIVGVVLFARADHDTKS